MKKVIIISAVAALLALAAWGLFSAYHKNSNVVSTIELSGNNESESAAEQTITDKIPSTDDQLIYLIEEEKLAHDIYSKLYEQYGARVFGNILDSESTHQSRVLSLLEARGIKDPRSAEIGAFTNNDLQSVYNELLEKGMRSEADAYEVGVLIEERDIADITAQLAIAKDDDVISTLEALRSGSENHLRAFNRQLGR